VTPKKNRGYSPNRVDCAAWGVESTFLFGLGPSSRFAPRQAPPIRTTSALRSNITVVQRENSIRTHLPCPLTLQKSAFNPPCCAINATPTSHPEKIHPRLSIYSSEASAQEGRSIEPRSQPRSSFSCLSHEPKGLRPCTGHLDNLYTTAPKSS